MNSLYLASYLSDSESYELGMIANDKHTYIFSGQNLFNIEKLHERLWWPHHIHQVSITISLQSLMYPQKSFLVHATVFKL